MNGVWGAEGCVAEVLALGRIGAFSAAFASGVRSRSRRNNVPLSSVPVGRGFGPPMADRQPVHVDAAYKRPCPLLCETLGSVFAGAMRNAAKS